MVMETGCPKPRFRVCGQTTETAVRFYGYNKPCMRTIDSTNTRVTSTHNGDGEVDGAQDAPDEEDDAPDGRVEELDLGEVGEAGLDALGHVADVGEQEDARDEEGGPEGEAEEPAAAEDVDDAADQAEGHLARLRHAGRALDKVRVPRQSHVGGGGRLVTSHLKIVFTFDTSTTSTVLVLYLQMWALTCFLWIRW